MKILCVGMNYAEHVKELNGGTLVKSESPVIFMKPDSARPYAKRYTALSYTYTDALQCCKA